MLTPAGKFICDEDSIIEVVGPFEVEPICAQCVSKYKLIVRCEHSTYTFGYNSFKEANDDAIYLDSF